jgi:hypothetical protein
MAELLGAAPVLFTPTFWAESFVMLTKNVSVIRVKTCFISPNLVLDELMAERSIEKLPLLRDRQDMYEIIKQAPPLAI